jgi:hypothetical protein
MADIVHAITLTVHTCWRGHIYAIPSWTGGAQYTCPMCAGQQQGEQDDENIRLLRRESQYKATITKLRNRLTP